MSFIAFTQIEPASGVVSFLANPSYDAYVHREGAIPCKIIRLETTNTDKWIQSIIDESPRAYQGDDLFFRGVEIMSSDEADVPADAVTVLQSGPEATSMEKHFEGSLVVIRNENGIFPIESMVLVDDGSVAIEYRTAHDTLSQERFEGDRLYYQIQ